MFFKFLRSLLTWVLLGGVVLVIGFLSFAGMLALWNVMAFAITTFFLAGFIEGEVYRQNILKSVEKLFDDGLKKEASQQILNKLLKPKDEQRKSQIKASAFLRACKKLQEEIEAAERRSEFDQEAEAALNQKKRELKWRQQYFHSWMMGKIQSGELAELDISAEKQTFQEKLESKKWLFRFCFLASTISGIGCGFVFLHIAPESILVFASHFGIVFSAAALPLFATALVYGFAVVSGAGYMLLVYNTLTRMVQEGTPQKWLGKIKEFFDAKPSNLRLFLGITGVSLVVVLCVLATVTATGTWWGDALASASSLTPYLGPAVLWVIGGVIVITGLTMLAFNLFNALRAVKKLSDLSWSDVTHSWEKLKKSVGKYWEKENVVQFLNPLRFIMALISVLFKPFVFLGHTVSTGLIGDRFDKFPVWLSAVTGTATDTLVDGMFVFAENFEHHHPKKKHENEANTQPNADQGATYTDSKTHPPSPKGDYHKPHDHTHADIPGWFLKGVFIITGIYALSVLWDWGFSHCFIWGKSNPLTFDGARAKAWYGLEALSKPKAKIEKASGDSFDSSWHEVCTHKIDEKAKKLPEGDQNALKQLNQALKELDSKNVTTFFTADKKAELCNGVSPAAQKFIMKLG
jgi:hypothetical protein